MPKGGPGLGVPWASCPNIPKVSFVRYYVVLSLIYIYIYHCYLSLSVWLYHDDYYCYSNYQLSVSLLLQWSVVLLWLLLVMLFRENDISHHRWGPQTPGFNAPCRGECSKEPWSKLGWCNHGVSFYELGYTVNPTVMARYPLIPQAWWMIDMPIPNSWQ